MNKAAELRALAQRIYSPGPGQYAPVGGHDTMELLEEAAKVMEAWEKYAKARAKIAELLAEFEA